MKFFFSPFFPFTYIFLDAYNVNLIFHAFRYNMNNRKRKLDKLLVRKPFFHIISLVASHFSSCEDNGKSEDSTMDTVSFSKHFNGRRLNVRNSRVLTFVHQEHHVPQGLELILFFLLFYVFLLSLLQGYLSLLAELSHTTQEHLQMMVRLRLDWSYQKSFTKN